MSKARKHPRRLSPAAPMAEREDLLIETDTTVRVIPEPAFGHTLIEIRELKTAMGLVLPSNDAAGKTGKSPTAIGEGQLANIYVVKTHPRYIPHTSPEAMDSPYKPGQRVMLAPRMPMSRLHDMPANMHIVETAGLLAIVPEPTADKPS